MRHTLAAEAIGELIGLVAGKLVGELVGEHNTITSVKPMPQLASSSENLFGYQSTSSSCTARLVQNSFSTANASTFFQRQPLRLILIQRRNLCLVSVSVYHSFKHWYICPHGCCGFSDVQIGLSEKDNSFVLLSCTCGQ